MCRARRRSTEEQERHGYDTPASDQGKPYTESVPPVLVLDPALGTGTFLYQIIDLIRKQFRAAGNAGKWTSFVKDQLLRRLHGFELLMAPYTVAHLK